MALTLDCVCSGNASTCTIKQLMMVIDIVRYSVGTGVSAIHYLTVFADPDDSAAPSFELIDPAGGSFHFDLAIEDWLDHWPTFTVELRNEQTLSQNPSPPFSSYERFIASYRIEQHYECVNAATGEVSKTVLRAYTVTPDIPPTNCEPAPTDIRAVCWAGRGVGSIFFKSSPFASCFGCTIRDYDFQPSPDTNTTIQIAESEEVCLCATGGTGDYQYSILDGKLACGRELDPDTGCITGTPDGTCPGSDTIMFGVVDRGGRTTEDGPVIIGGTCRLSGHNATRLSGGSWSSAMAGHTIVIDGVNYTVVSVMDASHLTVL